jgi:hypothetical protein
VLNFPSPYQVSKLTVRTELILQNLPFNHCLPPSQPIVSTLVALSDTHYKVPFLSVILQMPKCCSKIFVFERTELIFLTRNKGPFLIRTQHNYKIIVLYTLILVLCKKWYNYSIQCKGSTHFQKYVFLAFHREHYSHFLICYHTFRFLKIFSYHNSNQNEHSPVILQFTAERWACLARCWGLLAIECIPVQLLVKVTDCAPTTYRLKTSSVLSNVQ